MAREYDHLFKLLIIGDSGRFFNKALKNEMCPDLIDLCMHIVRCMY